MLSHHWFIDMGCEIRHVLKASSVIVVNEIPADGGKQRVCNDKRACMRATQTVSVWHQVLVRQESQTRETWQTSISIYTIVHSLSFKMYSWKMQVSLVSEIAMSRRKLRRRGGGARGGGGS